jgi:hypothetical protein
LASIIWVLLINNCENLPEFEFEDALELFVDISNKWNPSLDMKINPEFLVTCETKTFTYEDKLILLKGSGYDFFFQLIKNDFKSI